MSDLVLVLDAGPASLALQVHAAAGLDLLWATEVHGIGGRPGFTARGAQHRLLAAHGWRAEEAPGDHHAALAAIVAWLDEAAAGRRVIGIGHRFGHGGDLPSPLRVEPALLRRLEALSADAPGLAGLRATMAVFPDVPQVACFESSFHLRRRLPGRAAPADDLGAAPGRHGLSYEHLCRRLAAEDPALASGRTVIVHLGRRTSLCAVRAGRSLDSVDLQRWEDEAAPHPGDGVAMDGLPGDTPDRRAKAEALAAFVWRVRREIGALVAVLGGLDTLVFTAAVGEGSASMRAAICHGLGCFGIALAPARNAIGAREIGRAGAPVRVLVRHSDAALMVAEHVVESLGAGCLAAA
ncbi:hypothetical protein [Paracraurococcus ruber]|uniref:hypothetical protein n=1 Tax=Paracraurococcus ruber TaxID=77675 RepID=UPI00130526D1|nr:hypothetical protein [Paracraurococcus ruber]